MTVCKVSTSFNLSGTKHNYSGIIMVDEACESFSTHGVGEELKRVLRPKT